MSKDTELAHIVQLHKEWLRTGKKSGKRADLSGAMLDGRDLSHLDLSGALLRGTSLAGAKLCSSQFFHTDFSDANLREADLSNAILVLADFTGADLRSANLSNTGNTSESEFGKNKRGPRFTDANLQNTNFSSAWCFASDFQGASLVASNFTATNLEQANLTSCDLSGLDLSSANLTNINAKDSRFVGSNLKMSCLSGADLRGASLLNANIHQADLRSANLESCKVDGIAYDRSCLFRGIRTEGCYGSSRFKRFAEDQDYIEELKESHPSAYAIWRALTDCGRSMTRVALWSFAISFTFGLLYFSLGPSAFEISNPGGLQWNLFTTLYYSVVTFTTLGFGDITPNTPLAAGIVILEVIIGYIMLGILISILASKVARRS